MTTVLDHVEHERQASADAAGEGVGVLVVRKQGGIRSYTKAFQLPVSEAYAMYDAIMQGRIEGGRATAAATSQGEGWV